MQDGGDVDSEDKGSEQGDGAEGCTKSACVVTSDIGSLGKADHLLREVPGWAGTFYDLVPGDCGQLRDARFDLRAHRSDGSFRLRLIPNDTRAVARACELHFVNRRGEKVATRARISLGRFSVYFVH